MQYLVLIYSEEPTEAPDPAQIGAVMEEYNAYTQMLRDRGAFVSGEATTDELIGAIRGLARGELNCSPRVAALLLRRVRALAAGLTPFARSERLTSRSVSFSTTMSSDIMFIRP